MYRSLVALVKSLHKLNLRLNIELYNSMLPYIKENFKLAQQYILAEDWMAENNVFDKIGISIPSA